MSKQIQEAIKLMEEANHKLGSAWLRIYDSRDKNLDPHQDTFTENFEIRMDVNRLQVKCYDTIDFLKEMLEKEEKEHV